MSTRLDSCLRVRVLRLRIKDRHRAALDEMARAVNIVWNYCNELSLKVLERERRFVGTAELQRYLAGASKEGLAVGSAVFQQVAEEYATRRRQHRKRRLAWRVSGGARRSLGWIPFKARSVVYRGGQVRFQGHAMGLWDSYGLSAYSLRAGCFSQDARGRWYLNVTVAVAKRLPTAPPAASLGIDLGLKQLAAFSDEMLDNVEVSRFYRNLEPKLAIAQRARKSARVRALHAKIANRRRDGLHKLSTALANRYGAIFVGNVNAQALARGPHAKSVLDAGWSAFRTMLRYKCDDAGAWFLEVDEAYSTQTCSVCNSRTGPQGREGLGMREWICPHCGTPHDRDRNAARNILAAGHRRLAAGIPAL
ncbi:MAG TPA: transposase [Burkholderiaceae bacterium]|nr:transposase [Burkholderiaceae bacterium]